MRAIKFRAWHSKIGMLFSHSGDFTITLDDSAKTTIEMWASDGLIDTWHTDKLMQFTGLKDFNGVDIFEGDIIKKPNGDWGVIVYKAPSFEVTVDEKQSSLYSLEYFEDVEVIGNIYETPELLTQ